VTVGKTKRSQIHQLFGKPRIANEDWGVEVYEGTVGVLNTGIPPVYTTDTDSYYAMFIFNENETVKAKDKGVSTLDADNFSFYAYRTKKILLAPHTSDEFHLTTQESSNVCILYLIPDGYENINVSGIDIQWAYSKGYYRLKLAPGIHFVSFESGAGKDTDSIDCDAGNVFYVYITKKYMLLHRLESGDRGLGYNMAVTENPPDELFKRQLIIYPTMPEIIKSEIPPSTNSEMNLEQ
jgi:hypothetical protein